MRIFKKHWQRLFSIICIHQRGPFVPPPPRPPFTGPGLSLIPLPPLNEAIYICMTPDLRAIVVPAIIDHRSLRINCSRVV